MLLAMHIPDGLLDRGTVAVTLLLAIAGLAASFWRLRGEVGERLVPLIGMTSAAIFAGQMVNFPLLGLQTSGHLMGGVLAAVLVGPWGAVVALAAVLIVQCFVFADGGVAALGANIFNLGIIGGLGGYCIYAAFRKAVGGKRGVIIGSVVASWLTVPIAALAFSLEVSAGGIWPFAPVASAMLFYHAFIGLGEAVITGLVVSWLLQVRPQLIYSPEGREAAPLAWRPVVTAGMAFALAVAVFAAPWASEAQDGLERVAEQHLLASNGEVPAEEVAFAPFPDYALQSAVGQGRAGGPAAADAGFWQKAGVVTALLGALGTVATFIFAFVLARSGRWASRPLTAHAS